jgi:copper chaperone CopZ
MPSPASLTFDVPDMDCQSCVRSITAAVHRLDAAAEVTADLVAKRVYIGAESAQDFGKAIADAGFTVAAAA